MSGEPSIQRPSPETFRKAKQVGKDHEHVAFSLLYQLDRGDSGPVSWTYKDFALGDGLVMESVMTIRPITSEEILEREKMDADTDAYVKSLYA